MNEARLKIIPVEPSSSFGRNCQACINPELDGAMVVIRFVTPNEAIEVRCTHAWAMSFADNIKRRVEEFKAHCETEGVIPVAAKP